MTGPILTALSAGYSSRQVVNHLLRMFPQHATTINNSLSAGFTTDQILNFLSKGRKGVNELESKGEKTEFERTRESELENESKRTKNTLLGAAGIGAVGLGAGMASAALSRAAPQILPPLARAAPQLAGPGAILNLPQNQSPQSPQTPPQPPINAAQPQPNTPIQPTAPIAPTANKPSGNITEIFKTLNLIQPIDNYAKAGNGPDQIEGYLKKFHPQTIKEIEKSSGMSAKDAITSYLSESSAQSKEENKLPPTMPEEKIEDVIEPEVEEKPIEKADLVSSPKGVGTVLEVRGNEAILDIDGKKHKVNLDEIESSPIPEKDLADLYNDLVQGIEKHTGKQVSRNVEYAGYDPKSNELVYKPHGSEKVYVYDDISSDDVSLLTNFLTQRKSTGSNFIGAWEQGTESPIGAAMYQLIRKLQSERGGKGNEYKTRFETIYDALEPAKKAAKEKHAALKRKKKA